MTTMTVVLIDLSFSMDSPVSPDQRRIDAVAAILETVVSPNMRLVAFNDRVTVLEPGQRLPEPSGETLMHTAFDHLRQMSPGRVIVISDGEPVDEKAALASARELNCVITTFYCGDESNLRAIAFLKQLALCSRGRPERPRIADLRKPKQIAEELRLLLTGPTAA